ncbi:MAG TPA: hypothetical protein VJZ69_05750 [Clostridia bacterium]|nr:hypothetical protein [Clostridia bacterium]
MDGQKSAAKWLAIILLVSISIFSYAMYDSFFVSNSGKVQGENTTPTDSTIITPPVDDKEEPPKVVYSILPRPALKLGTTTIQHTGGYGEEVLLATHHISSTTIAILQTASNSFDYKAENHLALALFDNEQLISTLIFSDKDETFIDSKISSSGIVILTKTATNICKLRLFSPTIIPKGEVALDLNGNAISSASFYLDNTSLLLFALTDSQIICKSVSSTLALSDYCAPFNISNSSIVSIQKVNGNFVLALNSEAEEISVINIISMTAANGFILEKTVADQRAISLNIAVEDNVPFFLLTSKTQSAICIQKLSITFGTLFSHLFEGVNSAMVSQTSNGFVAVTPTSIYFLCRHLDSFYVQNLYEIEIGKENEFDTVKSLLYFGGKHYSLLYSSTTHNACLIEINSFAIHSLYLFGAENSTISMNVGTNSLRILFTTALRDGIFASSFGGKDVFYVAIDTTIK